VFAILFMFAYFWQINRSFANFLTGEKFMQSHRVGRAVSATTAKSIIPTLNPRTEAHRADPETIARAAAARRPTRAALWNPPRLSGALSRLIALMIGGPGAAEMYKCQDDQRCWHYTDRPPFGR
jgi:hypothetical protein